MGFVVGSIQKIWIILFVIHIICSIVTMVLAKIDLGSQNTDLENKAYKRGLTGLSISLILLAVVFLAMDKFLYFTEHFFKGTSA
jgi:Na+-driven multidrug efflux pump